MRLSKETGSSRPWARWGSAGRSVATGWRISSGPTPATRRLRVEIVPAEIVTYGSRVWRLFSQGKRTAFELDGPAPCSRGGGLREASGRMVAGTTSKRSPVDVATRRSKSTRRKCRHRLELLQAHVGLHLDSCRGPGRVWSTHADANPRGARKRQHPVRTTQVSGTQAAGTVQFTLSTSARGDRRRTAGNGSFKVTTVHSGSLHRQRPGLLSMWRTGGRCGLGNATVSFTVVERTLAYHGRAGGIVINTTSCLPRLPVYNIHPGRRAFRPDGRPQPR